MNNSVRIPKAWFFGLALCLSGLLSSSSFPQETIDGIVAVVNDEVITLTDVRISLSLGLHSSSGEGESSPTPQDVLNSLIDQRLVIQLTRGDLRIEAEELQGLLTTLSAELGPDEWQARLDWFDLDEAELNTLLRDRLVFEKILARKFTQTASVSLREIEAFYQQNYVPREKEQGRAPRPITEVLSLLETEIRRTKIRNQVADWLTNLRKEADVVLYIEKYPQFFKMSDNADRLRDSTVRKEPS